VVNCEERNARHALTGQRPGRTLAVYDAWVYAPCERTGRNGQIHVTFSARAHGT